MALSDKQALPLTLREMQLDDVDDVDAGATLADLIAAHNALLAELRAKGWMA